MVGKERGRKSRQSGEGESGEGQEEMTNPPPAFYTEARQKLDAATTAAYAAQYTVAAAWAAYNEGTMTYPEAQAVQEQTDAIWDAQRQAGQDCMVAYYRWCDESPTKQGEPDR